MSEQPEQLAASVHHHYWDGSLPVDVKSIAENIGIDVSEKLLVGVSGEAEQCDGRYMIYVNHCETDVRQRFTIAHELGHIVLGHVESGKKLRDPKQNYHVHSFDPMERDANRFAATLLMPSDAVRGVAAVMDDISIDGLARAFGVSSLAMKIRLKSMGVLA